MAATPTRKSNSGETWVQVYSLKASTDIFTTSQLLYVQASWKSSPMQGIFVGLVLGLQAVASIFNRASASI